MSKKRDEDMTDEEVIEHVRRQGDEMLERFLAAVREGKPLDEAFGATGRPVEVRLVRKDQLRELGEALIGPEDAPPILRKIWVYRTLDRKSAFALGYEKRACLIRDGFAQMTGLIDSDEDKQ